MEKTDKIFFPHLDPLRFVAAFMIIVAHAFEGWRGWFGPNKILLASNGVDFNNFGTIVIRFISNLNIGVDIFFLISGFLITFILIKEKDKLGYISLKKFYIRRLLRIWPLYFFLIAIAPFLVKWLESTPNPDYLSTIFFYNNFHSITDNNWTFPFAHFWSICVEEHFYIFWPLVIAFTPKKYLPSVFAVIIFISISFKFIVMMYLDNKWYQLYLNTLCRIDVMIIGAFMAYFHSIKNFKLNVPFIIRMLTYLLFIGLLFFDEFNDYSTTFAALFKKYTYIGLFGFAFLLYNFNSKSFLRFKPNSIIHYFGKTSYGIYMYGNIILLIIIKKIIIHFGLYNPYYYWLIIITTSIIVPIISYELLEKPFLKLKNKFSNISTKH